MAASFFPTESSLYGAVSVGTSEFFRSPYRFGHGRSAWGRHNARTTKMKKLLWLLFAPGIAVWPAPASAGGPAPLGQEAKAILQANCASCHGGGKAAKGGFGFVLERDLLVSRSLVTPGQAGQSDLFIRIQQGEMPPPSSKQRPSQAELKVLQRWIEAGAPAFDLSVKTAKILTPPETTEVILTDLQGLDPRRRRFMRYLTL